MQQESPNPDKLWQTRAMIPQASRSLSTKSEASVMIGSQYRALKMHRFDDDAICGHRPIAIENG